MKKQKTPRRTSSPVNVLRIIASDTRRICRSVVAMVVMFGLCVVPCLYAWFNIYSNWDPYGTDATSRIRIAVANEDSGADLLGLKLNIGEKVVTGLEANDSIGWVFTDSAEEALALVESGDCYAALVISSDFSRSVADIVYLEYEHPTLLYYENEKKNAIAPKITGKAKTAVQQQVNATFVETLSSGVGDAFAIFSESGLDFTTTVTELSDASLRLRDDLDNTIAMVKSLKNLINTLNTLFVQLSRLSSDLGKTATSAADAAQAGSGTGRELADELDSLSQSIIDTQNAADTLYSEDLPAQIRNLQNALDSALRSSAVNLFPELADTLREVSRAVDSAATMLDSFGADAEALARCLAQKGNTLTEFNDDLDRVIATLEKAQEALERVSDTLKALAESQYLEDLIAAISDNSEELGEYFASPIKMNTVVLYPIDNYGSTMAPFYSVLAQWVGALFCVALLKARVRRQDLTFTPTVTEEFFGRYALFLFIGLVQALVISAGNLYYLGIDCAHPGLFILAACITGICFSIINYALLFSLDKIGLGASVIVMVLQVAGSGGSYPVDVVPKFFRTIYPFMPFNYAMNAMREAIGGTYGNLYHEYIEVLLLTSLLFLILGLLLYYPAHWLIQMLDDSARRSEILH